MEREHLRRQWRDGLFADFAGYAVEVVCLNTPAFFSAVGQGYRNFSQTTDDEVIDLLDAAHAPNPPLRDEEVSCAWGPRPWPGT